MTTFKGNRRYPNPVTVTDDPRSHTLALQQIIEALNVGQRRTRDIDNSFVRLSELVEVGLIEIVNGQLKLTNTGSSAVAAGASALADLTDVDLTGLADGDLLIYDSGTSTWVPAPATAVTATTVTIRVRNATGSTITKGSAVYINGSVGANLPTVALAKADALDTSRAIGLVQADIANNGNGFVVTTGIIEDVDTSAFTAGDPVYVSPSTAGGLVNTRPSTSGQYIHIIGYVTIANPAVGEIKVLPGALSLPVDGGAAVGELNDLTDVVTSTYGGDPYWADVMVLLEFEGADASTTFTDTSTSGRTWSASGNAQIDTAIAKVGTGSLLLDGTGDWISTVDSADLEIADNEFTLECWIYVAAGATSDGGTHTIANKRDGGTAEEFSFGLSGVTGAVYFAGYSPADTVAVSLNSVSGTPGGVTIAEETWTHVAVSRVGSTVRLFVDGVMVDSTTSADIVQNAAPLYIGTDGFNTTRTFIGNIDQFRLTIGTGRYSTAFTPPTTPFPTALPDDYTPTDGQALTYDAGLGLWIPQTPLVSPLTTKGDLWGFSSTDARIPVGADGEVLTADSAEVLGVKWAAGGGANGPVLAPLDPRDYYYWEDHFTNQMVNFGSAGSDWDIDVSGAYTAVFDTTDDPDHLGVVKMSTITGNTGYIRLQRAPSSTNTRQVYAIGTTPLTMEWKIKTPANPASGAAEWYYLIGLGDTASIANTVEFILGYAGASQQIYGRCRSASVGTETSRVDITASTWYVIKAVMTSTSVEFFLDGVSLGTVTTNIPTVGMREQVIWGKSGTAGTAYDSYIDYVRMYQGLDEAIASATALAAAGSLAMAGDPYWNYVTALLQFDGADASTTMTDECGWTWTANGNAQLDTAQSKFGGSSLLLDGTGDYITTPDNTRHEVGSDDFTIEAWVRFAALPTVGNYMTVWSKRTSSATGYETWLNAYNAAGTTVLRFSFWNPGGTGITGTTAIAVDTWYHVAAVRRGPITEFFLDGVSEGTLDVGSTTITAGSGLLYLGRDGSTTARDLNGWIDSFRFTKGVARYTEAFTPPTEAFPVGPPTFVRPSIDFCTDVDTTSTAPVTGDLLMFDGTNWVPSRLEGDPFWDSVVILANANGSDAATSFTDEKGNVWTAGGNGQLDISDKKFGTASMLFDGVGDSFSLAAHQPKFLFGDLDFTIECWVKLNTVAAAGGDFVSRYNATSNQRVFLFGHNGSGTLRLTYSLNGTTTASAVGAGSTLSADGAWHHVAVTRKGSQIKFWYDGAQDGSTDTAIGQSTIYASTSARMYIGDRQSGSASLDGWIDSVRVTVGVARYDAAFTPPAAEFPDYGLRLAFA